MHRKIIHLIEESRRRYAIAKSFVQRYWKRGLAIAVVLFIVIKKDIDIDLQLSGSENPGKEAWLDLSRVTSSFTSIFSSSGEGEGFLSSPYAEPVNTSLLNKKKPSYSPHLTAGERESTPADNNLANTFSNLTFSFSEFGSSESERERIEKRRKQERYVRKYAATAQREMEEFGIPASITLAQGLLESNAGESPLAIRNNNHFGIKCFSRSCKKGHCSNFTDDHHKDFFRNYRTSEESFRSHSNLLRAKRYRKLFNLNPYDYREWAYGLKEAGYATDKYYAEKLIYLIEDLDLHRYDR